MSINIQKTLLLDRSNRGIESTVFLERTYAEYVKLMEQSNLLLNVQDKLTEIPKKLSALRNLVKKKNSNSSSSSNSSTESPMTNAEMEDNL